MADLTEEQKEQIEMAQRSRARIRETWDLFGMYLSQGARPAEALDKAREAVGVWADWMDSERIPFPEIEEEGPFEEFGRMLSKMVPLAQIDVSVPPAPEPKPSGEVDAEFVPSPEAESPAFSGLKAYVEGVIKELDQRDAKVANGAEGVNKKEG